MGGGRMRVGAMDGMVGGRMRGMVGVRVRGMDGRVVDGESGMNGGGVHKGGVHPIPLLLMDIRCPKKLTPHAMVHTVRAQSTLPVNPWMKNGL